MMNLKNTNNIIRHQATYMVKPKKIMMNMGKDWEGGKDWHNFRVNEGRRKTLPEIFLMDFELKIYIKW